MENFAVSRHLERGHDSSIKMEGLLTYAKSFFCESDFVRAWYCTNSRDIVLVTYVCASGMQSFELSDCEWMVTQLRFEVNSK